MFEWFNVGLDVTRGQWILWLVGCYLLGAYTQYGIGKLLDHIDRKADERYLREQQLMARVIYYAGPLPHNEQWKQARWIKSRRPASKEKSPKSLIG